MKTPENESPPSAPAPDAPSPGGVATPAAVEAMIARAERLDAAASPDSLPLAIEALEAARRIDRVDLISRAEHVLGLVRAAGGDAPAAARHFSDAAAGFEREPARRAESLRMLANVRGSLLGDANGALATLEHALAAASVAGSPLLRASVLGSLGMQLGRLGRLDEARAALESALAALESVDDPANVALQESNLGYLHVQCGRYAEALPHLERAVALAWRAGSRPVAINASGSLAIALAGVGRLADADSLAASLLAGLLPGDDRYVQLQLPLDLSRAKALAGDHAAARAALEKGLSAVVEAAMPALEIEYLEALAATAERVGDLPAALDYRKRLAVAERRRFDGEIASRVATIESVMRFEQQQRENRVLERARRDQEDRAARRTADLEEANRALAKSEQRFRDLTEMSSDWFWEQDEELRFVDFAHDHLARKDFDAHSFLGKRRWETGIEGVSEETWAEHRAALARHEAFRDLVFSRRNLKGEQRWYTVSGKPLFDETGRFTGYRGVGHDITERVRLEQALARKQRLEAMGQLAGGIAHEFNNIIGIVAGNARLLRESGGADADGLDRIESASRRAAALVEQILAFASGHSSVGEPVDLGAAVADAVGFLRTTLPAMLELRTRVAPGMHRVGSSTVAIHQVVVNLATNAADALRGRGVVDIELDRVAAPAPLVATAPGLARGPSVRLRVRDSGAGMDAATLARLFEPFFTTKPPGQGSGLGLAVVQRIVRDAGGAIDVESAPGRGTSVSVYLPLAEPAGAPVAPAAAAAPAGRGERVLYVDDDEALVYLVRRLLERYGYRVDGHQAPRAAVEALARDPGAYDALVTDLAMPGLSGLDLAARAVAIRPDLPVIVMSGYVRDADAVRAKAIGVRDICAKPTLVDDLVRALDRQLAGRIPAPAS